MKDPLSKFFPGIDTTTPQFRAFYNSLPTVKKGTKPRTIDLRISRRDAEYLHLMLTLPTVINEFTIQSSQPKRKRILNKLKRAGIK